jgi:hypothetical protein
VSNTYNNPSSNHTVNISKIKGYELSATIPAIAQEEYGGERGSGTCSLNILKICNLQVFVLSGVTI